jgi:hypothetical protein
MQKLGVFLVGMALAGCASTSAWRGLRIDATDESTFRASVAAFQQGLPPIGRLRFEGALEEIWTTAKAKDPDNLDQVTKTFLAQMDGLGYGEIVSLAGPAAKKKYLALAESPSSYFPPEPAPCTSCVPTFLE